MFPDPLCHYLTASHVLSSFLSLEATLPVIKAQDIPQNLKLF